jgi:hypothetical protein
MHLDGDPSFVQWFAESIDGLTIANAGFRRVGKRSDNQARNVAVLREPVQRAAPLGRNSVAFPLHLPSDVTCPGPPLDHRIGAEAASTMISLRANFALAAATRTVTSLLGVPSAANRPTLGSAGKEFIDLYPASSRYSVELGMPASPASGLVPLTIRWGLTPRATYFGDRRAAVNAARRELPACSTQAGAAWDVGWGVGKAARGDQLQFLAVVWLRALCNRHEPLLQPRSHEMKGEYCNCIQYLSSRVNFAGRW